VKKNEEGLFGNDRFEGFCVDLLREIAEEVGFKYSLYTVPDGQYGSPEKDGWTGMVRELIDNASIPLLSLVQSLYYKYLYRRKAR